MATISDRVDTLKNCIGCDGYKSLVETAKKKLPQAAVDSKLIEKWAKEKIEQVLIYFVGTFSEEAFTAYTSGGGMQSEEIILELNALLEKGMELNHDPAKGPVSFMPNKSTFHR